MKKKLTCALLAAVMVFALAACGSSGGKESEAPKNITGYTFEAPEGFTVTVRRVAGGRGRCDQRQL